MKKIVKRQNGFVLLEAVVALTIICGCLGWSLNTWKTWSMEKKQNIQILEKERARLNDWRKKI
ncbi:hypothetical protein [Pediococcus claussenii]|uniref:Uncharacterized protein n=1 Tax=Pediococcus claussenii (strain ATCC BAA-344 / DSM 14800 / JCM 18046 / KCTC 3811 / LMG 21948 / P06) TaxID=701521 RepID=G8PCQ6_PEDCP|nr:hypothetical protein [Pediococcus claussenii]AEV95041.1 hypothetical protein PECL_750 [Pediococcus claussenii ATCC BAA-344]ANZ70230.1 hypothetical protein AYR57_07795 [Pediococcus claussenii]ANZ72046.1 hypothetical protein AYR58_07795 [Pediococcus claussenii]KRN19157.1 hypothetical protein IV79_GL001529 [Pediococcus claussenii]